MQTESQFRNENIFPCDSIKPIIPNFSFIYDLNIKQDLKDLTYEFKEEMKNILENDIEKKPDISDVIIYKDSSIYCVFCKTSISELDFYGHECDEIKSETCLKCKMSFTEKDFSQHSCKVLECEQCGRNYTIRSKFESHLRQHARIKERKSLAKTFICNVCNKKIVWHSKSRHLKMHKKQTACPKCDKLVTRSEMEKHMKIHRKYKCSICGKPQRSVLDLVRHEKIHEKEVHSCDECGTKFQFLCELARHITKQHRQIEGGKIECPICKKIVSAIGHHLRTHEKNPKWCEKCNAELPNYSAYKSHMRFHDILSKKGSDRPIIPKSLQPKKLGPVQCTSCVKIFPSLSSLAYHSKCHIKFAIYGCKNCETNSYETLIDLLHHVNVKHVKTPDSLTQCHLCLKIVRNINAHLTTHESPEFHCETCNITFKDKIKYRRHYNQMHNSKQNHEKTGLHVIMTRYQSKTLNFKKVVCLHCHKKVRICHMNSHISSHSTLTCITCQKIFFNQKHLELHENMHNHRSQRCPHCSQSFLSHVRLMAHLIMYHKVAFSKSKECSRCIV